MEELFTRILQMSLTGSVLALTVIALRLVLRKTPKRLVCLLWGLVALRLVCPFSVESRLSLMPEPIADGQVISQLVERSEPEYFQSVPDDYSAAFPMEDPNSYYESPLQPVPEKTEPMEMLGWIWVIGLGLMLLYAEVSYLLLLHRMGEATRLEGNIWQCARTDSPFVLGLFRPRIYLPYQLQTEDLPHVIAHEQAHIRRKDHWWKPLGFFLLSVHWFNPVLWVSYILLCRDIESACDEAVIASMEKPERQAYSTALLRCSVRKNAIAACPIAFGEVGVKERVTNVMHYKKPKFWIMVIALIVCAVVAVCFLTNPPMDTLKALPEVHSHSYGIVEVTYESYNDKAPDMDRINGLRFRVTEDMVLGIKSKSEVVSYTGWADLGTLTETELTRDNFDRICYHEDGWFQRETAAEIRKNTARAWELVLEERGQFYYLIQMKNGELFLAEGDWDTGEKNDPASDDTCVNLLYRIAVDVDEDYNLLAKSGENTAAVQIYPADTAIRDIRDSVHWLNIDGDSDTVPFRTYQHGEEVLGYYNAFDAKTYEPIDYHVPSGLEPQTYLFQNGQPGKDYIVIMKLSTEPDAPIYAFGARMEKDDAETTKAGLSEIAVAEPLDLEASSGVGVEIAFESEDMLIFYGDFGLFGYDLKANELKFSVDFVKAVGIEGSVQGSYGTAVEVSGDGNTIIISEYNAETETRGKTCYIDVPSLTYENGEYQPLENAFQQEKIEGSIYPGVKLSQIKYMRDGNEWSLLCRIELEQDGILQAKLLEIHDGYYLVEPVAGSWELTCADKIQVPRENVETTPEPQVGEILLIEYDGQIMETYPARIATVYSISVLKEIEVEPTDDYRSEQEQLEDEINRLEEDLEGAYIDYGYWGVELSVTDVTPTGLTVVCRQSGGEPTGTLYASNDYWLVNQVE